MQLVFVDFGIHHSWNSIRNRSVRVRNECQCGLKWRPGGDLSFFEFQRVCGIVFGGHFGCFLSHFGMILGVILKTFLMIFCNANLGWKIMNFWESMFYRSESITFDGQGSIWRVTRTSQIGEKWSRRGSKSHAKSWCENCIKQKFAKSGPAWSAAYTERFWCFQFL